MEGEKIKVLLFGVLKDIIGLNEIYIEKMNIEDVNSLKKYLLYKFPALKNYSFSIAVNYEIVHENKELKSNDEVALIPPVSGG